MLTSIGKSPGSPWSEFWKKKRKSHGEKDLQKWKVLNPEWNSQGVMGYESGESTEKENCGI